MTARVTPASAHDPPAVAPRPGGVFAGTYSAMASPCEVLFAGLDRPEALALTTLAAEETRRIEAKYSRYRPDSVISQLNQSAGTPVAVDTETAELVSFAIRCYELSDGLFDITSGVLRRVWRFDGSDRLPSAQAVTELLPLVGLNRLTWEPPHLSVPAGMELDLGGIGKEYAVDRVFALLSARCRCPLLVNFGGDLRASTAPATHPWRVGVERPDSNLEAALVLELESGALATSGDARRFLLRDGVRYGHILDPRTGWPVVGAPRSVTVAASSCTEAGLLSTLALLQGTGARGFLEAQQVRFWILE